MSISWFFGTVRKRNGGTTCRTLVDPAIVVTGQGGLALPDDPSAAYRQAMQRHATPHAFDIAYEGTPSWETGRPQPAVLQLLGEGVLGRRVLDAGCGTGLHAMLVAASGHDVMGVDVASAAVARARQRSRPGPGTATFVVADVFELAGVDAVPGGPFDTVLDVGLFHVLQPEDRRDYAASLAGVTRMGGNGFVVAWSERNPFGYGPGRIRRSDLRDAFRSSTGWRVIGIEATVLETRLEPGQVHAWLARLQRVTSTG
jgi:SAM-dependent methyltransferase